MSAVYPLVRNLSAFSTRLGVETKPSRPGSSPRSASSRLIRSCICLFYISGVLALGASDEADGFYAKRTDLASARRAEALWAADIVTNPRDFDAAWKLARADYWLGGHAPEPERRMFLEKGIDAGQKAVALQPGRAEGHFWIAA